MLVAVNDVSSSSDSGSIIEFTFELEDDDKKIAESFNAGKLLVELMANSCRFYFPFHFPLPHPDLCCLAALKIISPYIGGKLTMDRPISVELAGAILKYYPNITGCNFTKSQPVRNVSSASNIGLAFSGGGDSTAAAFLLPPESTFLISLIRKEHPDVGEFEKWHRGDLIGTVLDDMPRFFNKIPVHSDFPFTSKKHESNYVAWADSYWYFIPLFLLAECLGLKHITNGDVLCSSLGNQIRFSEPKIPSHHKILFPAVSLDYIPLLVGGSEVVTETIVRQSGRKGRTFTCEFGEFLSPCMSCVKCLRKTLINRTLDGEKFSFEEIERFNNSKAISNLLKNKKIPFTVTYHYAFSTIEQEFSGLLGELKQRVLASYKGSSSWLTRVYSPVYNESHLFSNYLNLLCFYVNPMTDDDLELLRALEIKA